MKTITKKSKDETKEFTFNYPEHGDRYIAEFSKVGTNTFPFNNEQGKAVMGHSNFLGVLDNDGNKITIVISDGQKKVADKTEDLKGKTIVFESYEHKKYGKLLGLRVLKEDKKE